MSAPLPPQEPARLRAMWRYTRHDRTPDPVLDEITWLAAELFSAPLVLVSLVDEDCQWFKSRVGAEVAELPRDDAFCAHAILGEGLFEVPDAAADPRFRDNPLVAGPPYVRYYLGAPLITPEGFAIGTLCFLDVAPRRAKEGGRRQLATLARQVMNRLELLRLARLERHIGAAGMGVWELDVPSDVVWGNAEFQRLHGREDQAPRTRLELARDYLPEDRARLQAGLERLIHDGEPFEACLRMQGRAEDRITWVQLTGTRMDGGMPARHLAGTLQDITLLKRKERELAWWRRIDQLVTRLQSRFINGDDISGTFGEALETLLRFTDSELGLIGEVFRDAGEPPRMRVHAMVGDGEEMRCSRLERLYARVLATGKPLIANGSAGDTGALRSLLCMPVRLEGDLLAMLVLANRSGGYSEHSLALLEPLVNPLAQLFHGLRLRCRHDAAWKRLELSAKVFSSSREAIMISDSDNRIIEVNESFERITGYAREEVLGENPRILSSGRQTPAFYERLWQALNEEGFWKGEVLNRRKNGELLPEMLSISVVRDEAGRVTHHVAVFSDLTRIKQHADELFRAGHFDRLTGLPNRYQMIRLMHEALGQRHRSETLAVGVLDLDNFQELNVAHGREAADRVLVAAAARLAEAAAPGDVVARLGGDEFGLLLHGFQGGPEPLERILGALAEPLRLEGAAGEVRVKGSLGVTLYPADNADPETLLRHADQAMYRAKVLGGNSFMLFDPDREQEVKALQSRRHEIARALENDEFVLYYQPQVDPRCGEVAGVEALIRWQHPTRGLLAPGSFLPAIEGSDLEPALDAWVLSTALRQLEVWRAAGLSLSVCLNLTPQSLTQEAFVTALSAELKAHPGLAPEWVCLEVLESTALEDIRVATGVMRRCRELGVQVALDDFGTGYSSLAYLRDLPVDTVKVDRSFVMAMLESDQDLAIVESVVYLARRFGKQVIAEGVETDEHGRRLADMGCDLLQGFGIARPMPAEELPAWCRALSARRLPQA